MYVYTLFQEPLYATSQNARGSSGVPRKECPARCPIFRGRARDDLKMDEVRQLAWLASETGNYFFNGKNPNQFLDDYQLTNQPDVRA